MVMHLPCLRQCNCITDSFLSRPLKSNKNHHSSDSAPSCSGIDMVKPNRWKPHGYWAPVTDASTSQQRKKREMGPLRSKIREIHLAASTRSNCWSPQKQGLPANKKGDRENLSPRIWWSWGELNPRPQAFFEWFYMLSRLIEFSFKRLRSGTPPFKPVTLRLTPRQVTRRDASLREFPCS